MIHNSGLFSCRYGVAKPCHPYPQPTIKTVAGHTSIDLLTIDLPKGWNFTVNCLTA